MTSALRPMLFWLVLGACAIGHPVAASTPERLPALGFSITVEPANESGEFTLAAVVRDLDSGEVLFTPTAVIKAGAEMTLEVAGSDHAAPGELALAIDSTMSRATWRYRITHGARTVVVSEGSVSLTKPATAGY